eukprot:TRINITY_DN2008_c0_g1_i1.p1 TRINITY_DN2008_c0_g1~~TRINITY_DN2008_c0_g1_i1.p1  ORF type:complete len:543 (+),score=106.73 TRINITY_DN2008_c0_g1_i1:32-1660(+)
MMWRLGATCLLLSQALGLLPPHAAKWHQEGVTAGHEKLRFIFGLRGAKPEVLESNLLAVSDPKSDRYGQYLTTAEIRQLVAIPDGHAKQVEQWALSRGASAVEHVNTGDYVVAYFTAANAAQAFGAGFCWYRHADGDRTVRACGLEYTLPAELSGTVDYISGLSHFPLRTGAKVQRRRVADGAPLQNTPKALRTLYNIPPGTKNNASSNTQCVTGFLNQWFSKEDLAKFLTTYTPELQGQQIAQIIGPDVDPVPGTEANLDVQYVMAMGAEVPTWFWSDDRKNDINNQEPWLDFLLSVSNRSAGVPNIISMSYGEGEHTLTLDFMNKCSAEVQKLGLRGITLLASSGDDGAGCYQSKFEANWIAASPWLTAVGGTTGGTNERAASLSSGGFSNFFPMPAYQKAFVSTYLQQTGLPSQNYYNITGRAFPDISAVAEDVPICEHGICGLSVAGTSCASPTFAGIVGLLNSVRLAAGKPTLGFLNPLLYQIATNTDYPFNDITEGTGGGGCGVHGFPAKPKWDAVTGLGSPNFVKLAAAIMAATP